MVGKRCRGNCLITAEKDYVQIAHIITWPVDLVIIGLGISFGSDDAFNAFVKSGLIGI